MFFRKGKKECGRIVAYINDTPIRIGEKISDLPQGVYEMDIPGIVAWHGIIMERADAEKEAKKYVKRCRINDAIFFAKHGMIGMSLECFKGCIFHKKE